MWCVEMAISIARGGEEAPERFFVAVICHWRLELADRFVINSNVRGEKDTELKGKGGGKKSEEGQ